MKKPTARTILTFLGVSLLITALYGFKKVKTLQNVFYNFQLVPMSLSNIKVIGLKKIKFDLDIKFINPTADDFDLSGLGIVKLTKIKVYNKENTLLGFADNLNLTEFVVEANKSLILKKIPIEIDTTTLLTDVIFGGFSTQITDYIFEAVLEIAGEEYIITQ